MRINIVTLQTAAAELLPVTPGSEPTALVGDLWVQVGARTMSVAETTDGDPEFDSSPALRSCINLGKVLLLVIEL